MVYMSPADPRLAASDTFGGRQRLLYYNDENVDVNYINYFQSFTPVSEASIYQILPSKSTCRPGRT